MFLRRMILTALFALAPLSSFATPPAGYSLVWNDEFYGDKLDETKWGHRYLGKRKLGYTTADSISVSGGTLKNKIHIKDGNVCSGMIGTQGKFET